MKHYLWAVVWGIIVLFLISMPIDVNGSRLSRLHFPGVDKLVHTGIFFVFTTLLLFGSLKNQRSRRFFNLSIVVVFIVSSLFAISTELIQEHFTEYRSFELLDIFADHVGIGMAFFSYCLFLSALRRIVQ